MSYLNRLAKETSSYLLQHADNPVDWYPWGKEALEAAKYEHKPILLSIGYSACHWCHVMAHESFADVDTAHIMNKFFINIKVDREERPDLDKIYQTTYQLLTGRAGGWPLTVFLTPEQHLPFFAGTYFPKESRYNLPAFKALLQYIADFFQHHLQEIEEQERGLQAALQQLTQYSHEGNAKLNLTPWNLAIKHLRSDYDLVHGGFGSAPKFPNPSTLELLIYDSFTSPQSEEPTSSTTMLKNTLNKMAEGGIYDHIGGGFFRYSVDKKWEIPHFEKMLYDNAQLLLQYTYADLLEPSLLFKETITGIIQWTKSMQSADGGFYSSIDADSEKKEGQFYLWTPKIIETLLNTQEYAIIKKYFNLNDKANFEDQWHLHIACSFEEVARQEGCSTREAKELISSSRKKLFHAREHRIFPHQDKKILLSWNALMIKGMLLAGIHCKQTTWIHMAERALRFIQKNAWKNKRLWNITAHENSIPSLAYLDDYAFLLDSLLILLQYQWNREDFIFAKELADALLEHFYDPIDGGFFFVAHDHEKLIYRPKIFADEAIPAGNSLACYAIQRLGYLLGEQSYLSAVEKSLQAAWPSLLKYPQTYSSLLLVLREFVVPPKIIIIRGNKKETEEWHQFLIVNYLPSRMVLNISNDEVNLSESLAKKVPTDKPIAYVCQGYECSSPITEFQILKNMMKTE